MIGSLLAAAFVSSPSLRDHLLSTLARPDVAVVVLTAGILLLYLECNRPGAILPGALGLLLTISAGYALALHPLRPAALLLLLASVLTLALAARVALFPLLLTAGTAGLVYGLSALVASPGIHLASAVCCGLLLGPPTALLGRIALRARRNKAILITGASPVSTPASQLRTVFKGETATRAE